MLHMLIQYYALIYSHAKASQRAKSSGMLRKSDLHIAIVEHCEIDLEEGVPIDLRRLPFVGLDTAHAH